MKIVSEPTIKRNNPYEGYIYECRRCGAEVEIEETDLDSIIKKPYYLWYECNMPRDKKDEHYIRCPRCGRLIPLFIAEECCMPNMQTREIVNIGVKKSKR